MTGTHAQADDAAAQPLCPPFCPNQGKADDRSHERRKEHDRFRKLHHDGQPDFEKSHRKSYRHHKRSHSKGKVRLRFYPRYYDPLYYDPFYNDPYYDWIDESDYSEQLTCKEAIAELRHRGYRNVKAFDCRGETYGFYATLHKKRYKITVDSFDGHIISRKRIAR